MGCLRLDIEEHYRPTLKVVHGDGDVAQRWLSTDPLATEFPGWSPYNYVMGNPINMVDPDGRRPLFSSDASAALVAGDLNKMLSAATGVAQDYFYVSATVRTESQLVSEGFWPWQDDVYQDVEVTYYTLETNSDVSWDAGSDDPAVAKAMRDLYDSTNMDYDFKVAVGDNEKPYGYELRDGHGGGRTPKRNYVEISSQNSHYGDRSTTGTSRMRANSSGHQIGWTFGGVYGHEVGYHVLNRTDGGDPNVMRKALGVRTGDVHGNKYSGSVIGAEEQRQLDYDRSQTGGN